MSVFYTNIQLAGDTILYRGIKNGEPVQFRCNFSPTLYVLSNKTEKFKTLDGRSVTPMEFESARKASIMSRSSSLKKSISVAGPFNTMTFGSASANFSHLFKSSQINLTLYFLHSFLIFFPKYIIFLDLTFFNLSWKNAIFFVLNIHMP